MKRIDWFRAKSEWGMAHFIMRITRACREEDCENCPIGQSVGKCDAEKVEKWLSEEGRA